MRPTLSMPLVLCHRNLLDPSLGQTSPRLHFSPNCHIPSDAVWYNQAMGNPSTSNTPFLSGFFNGAKSGAMMMGIFTALMATAHFTFPLIGLSAVAPAFSVGMSAVMLGLGTLSTGLFSGYNAMNRACATPSSAVPNRAPARAPEQAMGPVLAPAIERQTNWAESVGNRPSHAQRIDHILNSRGSAKDHASAILAARADRDASATTR